MADRRGFVLTTHGKMTFVERAEMKPAMQFAKKIPTSCTGGFRIAGAPLVLATFVFQLVEWVIRAEAAGAGAADHESLERRAPPMKSRVRDRRGVPRRSIVGGAQQLLLAGRHRSVDVDDFKYRVQAGGLEAVQRENGLRRRKQPFWIAIPFFGIVDYRGSDVLLASCVCGLLGSVASGARLRGPGFYLG